MSVRKNEIKLVFAGDGLVYLKKQKQAQDEGYAFYAARRVSREHDARLERLSNGSGTNHNTGTAIGDPTHQVWRRNRTQTRKWNLR